MYEISVGCGKKNINVPDTLFPFPIYADYWFDEMGESGDLYARALVIDNGQERFLFVGTDVADAPGIGVRRRITEQFGIPEDHMYVTATHNHSAPHGGGRKGGKGGRKSDPVKEAKEAAYAQIYEQGILDAVEEALANLRPARYGYGEGESYINVNRDYPLEDGYWTQGQNLAGPSDKTLAVLKFEDMEGKLIGAVVNYACHGTTAFCVKDFNGKIRVTPGFAGIACSYAEARLGDDAVILWTNGASGDQNPLFSSEGFPRAYDPDGYTECVPTPPGTQYLIQKSHGCAHGVDIIRTLGGIRADRSCMPITTARTEVMLDAQRPPEGADMFLNKMYCDNSIRTLRPDLCEDGRPPEKKLVTMIPDGTTPLTMHMALLGDMGWVGIYGEPYCTIGMKCKAASPLRHTIIVLHVDDENGAGYIPDDASKDHTVFQAFSHVRPGHVDDAIVGGMLTLCDMVGGDSETV